MYISREDARGVAGVAAATPKFQVLLYKMVLKISKKFFIYYAGYTYFKFLTSSLIKIESKMSVKQLYYFLTLVKFIDLTSS